MVAVLRARACTEWSRFVCRFVCTGCPSSPPWRSPPPSLRRCALVAPPFPSHILATHPVVSREQPSTVCRSGSQVGAHVGVKTTKMSLPRGTARPACASRAVCVHNRYENPVRSKSYRRPQLWYIVYRGRSHCDRINKWYSASVTLVQIHTKLK